MPDASVVTEVSGDGWVVFRGVAEGEGSFRLEMTEDVALTFADEIIERVDRSREGRKPVREAA